MIKDSVTVPDEAVIVLACPSVREEMMRNVKSPMFYITNPYSWQGIKRGALLLIMPLVNGEKYPIDLETTLKMKRAKDMKVLRMPNGKYIPF